MCVLPCLPPGRQPRPGRALHLLQWDSGSRNSGSVRPAGAAGAPVGSRSEQLQRLVTFKHPHAPVQRERAPRLRQQAAQLTVGNGQTINNHAIKQLSQASEITSPGPCGAGGNQHAAVEPASLGKGARALSGALGMGNGRALPGCKRCALQQLEVLDPYDQGRIDPARAVARCR